MSCNSFGVGRTTASFEGKFNTENIDRVFLLSSMLSCFHSFFDPAADGKSCGVVVSWANWGRYPLLLLFLMHFFSCPVAPDDA
jgi:hypothetical protein